MDTRILDGTSPRAALAAALEPRSLLALNPVAVRTSAFCSLGMMAGLMLDVRGGLGALRSLCSARADLLSALTLHLELMPFAHMGMALGAFGCIAYRAARKEAAAGAAFQALWHMVGMVLVSSFVWFVARQADPISSMMLVAALMLVFGMVASPTHLSSRFMPRTVGAV